MPRALLLLLLCFPAAASAAVDRCNGLISAAATEAISRAFPSYRLPQSTDNLEEDIEYNLSQGGTGCLGVARADFDGDGRQDFLVGLPSVEGDGAAVVVALNHERAWVVERLDEWPSGRARLFVEAGAPGLYERTEALGGPPSEVGEVVSLKCKHGVAIFGATESTGVAYCKVGSKWLHVWVSD